MSLTLLNGDCLSLLATLPSESVQCCVTSPPYYGLRDYGLPTTTWPDGWVGCLGLEPTPEMFIAHLVAIFEEVRRVLRADGTAWVNMGDSYAGSGKGGFDKALINLRNRTPSGPAKNAHKFVPATLKAKDMLGMPWMMAFALRTAGWYLRSEIIWHKPNPMPESVNDRPTKTHEQIFLLSKSSSYFYDAEAIREPASENTHARLTQNVEKQIGSHRANGGSKTNGAMKAVARGKSKTGSYGVKNNSSFAESVCLQTIDRNKRSVWTVPTQGYAGAHFATFPEALIRPCIQAGSRPGDTILDPFGGSGTTGKVAIELGRRATLIELNPAYCELIQQRCSTTMGLAL